MTTRTSLSAEEAALGGLAQACLYLLLGIAYVEFPTSDRSGPSKDVLIFVHPHKSTFVDSTLSFPVRVDGERWEAAVVPVLGDRRWASTNPLMRERARQGDQEGLVCLLEGALVESHRAAGLIL
jgi:hypothetical protein